MIRPPIPEEGHGRRRCRWLVRGALGGWAAIAWAGVAALGQASRPIAITSVRTTTTLVGVVGDSIHGGPLAGAVILLDGQSREGVTDSIGRFRIDSIEAGFYRVGIFHPILDSLGTSLASRPVQFRAGKPLLISMATPSGRTLRHAICPELPPHRPRYEHGDSGVAVVVGRVLEAESNAPVPAATVTISWVETAFSDASVRVTPYQRTTVTDPSGDFRFCAVPSGLNGLLRATSAPRPEAAVERELDLENRIVTMATVHLAARDDSGQANPVAEAVLTGDVQRPDGSPFAGATAIIVGTTDSAVTDAEGIFTFKGLPSGTHMVVVRSVGFEPVSDVVELANREPQHVSIALATPARAASPSEMDAERLRAGYALVGFDRRRRDGLGQFLTADEIAAKHAHLISELLVGPLEPTGGQLEIAPPPPPVTSSNAQTAPGRGQLQPSLRNRVTNRSMLPSPAGCRAYVLDGHPLARALDGNLDALYHPDEIAGIEVYRGVSPLEFRASLTGPNASLSGTPPDDCTTIVVWTKAHLGVD